METPKFTVVTPTFNQGAYIEKTIDSVLSQGYKNLEYIIIDGGSKDNTVDIIKRYEKHLAYWISEPDRGQSHAINNGMARATGAYLTWLNSDDWYLQGALAMMAEMFASNPAAGMVVGAGRIVDAQGKQVYYKAPTEQITVESLYGWLKGGDFMQPSSAFRADAWQRAGGVDERVHIALDVDLWLRMAKAGVLFSTTSQLLSEALSHPNAKTTAFEDLMRLDCSIVIIRHGGEEVVRRGLEDMVNRYSWYRRNYEPIVSHPVMRILRPLVKRISAEGNYWQAEIPPWVKGS